MPTYEVNVSLRDAAYECRAPMVVRTTVLHDHPLFLDEVRELVFSHLIISERRTLRGGFMISVRTDSGYQLGDFEAFNFMDEPLLNMWGYKDVDSMPSQADIRKEVDYNLMISVVHPEFPLRHDNQKNDYVDKIIEQDRTLRAGPEQPGSDVSTLGSGVGTDVTRLGSQIPEGSEELML